MKITGILVEFFVTLFYLCCCVESQKSDPQNGIIVSKYSWFSESHLMAYPSDVYSLNSQPVTNTYHFDSSGTDITSIAPDIWNQSLYYIDRNSQGVYRLENANISLDSSAIKETLIHEGISDSIGAVSFDWVAKNVYWTDRYHNWIAMRPAFTNDSLMYKIILEDQIVVPVAMGMDIIAGYMFWSDTQPSARIERSNLSGENRTVIVARSLQFINSIVTDHVNERIYWTDYSSAKIESISYEGVGRKVITRVNNHYLLALALFKEHLCVTEESNNALICIDKNDGTYEWGEEYSWFDGFVHAVAVLDKDSQPVSVTNYCSTAKCTHICISTAKGANCLCKEGYQLQKDGFTCKARHALDKKGILFTNGTNICIVDVHTISGATHPPQCIAANLTGVSKYLQADSNNGYVYFWNSTAKEIQSYNTATKTFSFTASTSSGVSGMFYNWLEHSIIWSESDTNSIQRVYLRNLDSNYIYRNINKVSYLTGNPHRDMLYWISGDKDSYLVEGASSNGDTTTRYTVMESKDLYQPSNLYFAEIYDELYFVDEDEAKKLKTNGSGLTPRVSVGGEPESFVVYKDYVVWTDGKDDIKSAFVLSRNTDNYIVLTEHNHVTGICVFDPRLQRPERRQCEDNNGGCQHICIHTQTGYECQCPLGMKLDKDGKKCTSEVLTTNYALIADYIHNKIYQIPMKKPFNIDEVVALNIPSVQNPHGALYDKNSDFLYWADFDNQQIKRVKMNGENESTVYTFTKELYPDRLVFDDSTGNLFFTALPGTWADDNSGYVGVLGMSSDPPLHKVLVDELVEPRCLALYPSKGYLFWGESGSSDVRRYIGRSNMDGTNRRRIIEANKPNPIGLAIDYTADRLYWVDFFEEEIRSSYLDGSDMQIFFKAEKTNPVDLKIRGNFLYFIGWNKRKITVVNMTSKKEEPWMSDVPEIGRLDSLQIYPPQPQPVSTTCSASSNTQGCSTFCFPREDGYKCGCEDGVKLRDSRHCENVCYNSYKHVKVQRECVIRTNGKCKYSCTGHLATNASIPEIQCLPNGTWDQPEEVLCTVVECSKTLPDVYITRPCMLKIGDSCNFTCKDNRLRKSYTRVKCSSGGVWVPNKDLCKEVIIKTCPAAIKNGKLSRSCSRQAINTECKFTCDNGFESRLKNEVLVCHTTGQWSFDTDKLCIGTASLATQTSPEVIAMGAGLGTLVFVLVIVIIVVVFCCYRNRQRSKQDEEDYFDDSTAIPRRSSQKQLVPGKSQDELPPVGDGDAFVSIGQRGQGIPPSQQQGLITQNQTTDAKPQFKSVINIGKHASENTYERF